MVSPNVLETGSWNSPDMAPTVLSINMMLCTSFADCQEARQKKALCF